MSGLYLLALLAVWLLIGWVGYRVWYKRKPEEQSGKKKHLVIGVLLFAVWFGGAFWEVAGQKIWWDVKVDRLCAQDGGIKIYETVELPPEMFDKWGQVKVPAKKDLKFFDVKPDYYYTWVSHDYNKGHIDLYRDHFKIYRLSDGEILGEAISYARRGGDLPGPWHHSSYRCPQGADVSDLKKHIFIKNIK